MHDLYLPRALKEGRHEWNPSVKRDRRGATLERNIFLVSRAARENQHDFTSLQNVDGIGNVGIIAAPASTTGGRSMIAAAPRRYTDPDTY
jgi:hypothetical protein